MTRARERRRSAAGRPSAITALSVVASRAAPIAAESEPSSAASRATRRSTTWSPIATPIPTRPSAVSKTPNGRFWIGKSVPAACADGTHEVTIGSCEASSIVIGSQR